VVPWATGSGVICDLLSILGILPFTLALPYATFLDQHSLGLHRRGSGVGVSRLVVYAQEIAGRVGMISACFSAFPSA